MRRTNDLGRDPVFRLVCRLAIPTMLAQLVSVLYSIVDRIYIGNIPEIGDLALAGVGVCGPIVTLLSSFASLVGLGGSPILAMRMGEGKPKEAARVLSNSFLMLLVLSGALTLAIMVLPLILRTTEEALLSVPDSYREGSLALGAGKLRTVMKVVLPPASGGIFAGIILATGRIVGETAALIYTAGTVAKIALNPMSSGSTLAVHVYVLSGEGLHVGEAYATAVVLMVIVFLMNALSSWIAKRCNRNS